MNTPSDKNRRVLVIDDNRSIHDDFRKILSPASASAVALQATEKALFGLSTDAIPQREFEIDSAFQGQEGVLLVKKALDAGRPYALAFVDVRMPPGWDGVETIQNIWAIDPNLQTVICTAYSDYSWGEMFEKLGQCDGLLILKKPFDAVEALQLAYALTEKWWLHRQSLRKMEELESRVDDRTRELQQTNQALELKVIEHERAEESLRLLGAAVEQAKESIVITDAELDLPGPRILFVNPAFTKMTGYTAKEVLGKTPRILQGPHSDRAVLRRLRATLSRGDEFEGETINYRKDRTEFNLEWNIAPIRNASGKVTHFAAIQRNVTERKLAENALRESNEKFHQLADNITDAFWIRSPDMREVHYVSPAFERIWGRSVASLYANPQQWADFILPEDRERALDGFAALASNSPNLDIEYRIVRPDGEIRWVRVRGFQVRDAENKLIRHIGIVTDITERKQAEEMMRESEERFSGAFEHAPIGVALVSSDGRWLRVNRALCELVGYSEAELLAHKFQDITHPEDLEVDLENVRRMLAGEIVTYQMEKRYVHAHGHLITALLNVSLVRDGQGHPLYFISHVQDITERKRLEAQLFQSQKMETVGKLAGGIAHEFNSILTAIIGQSELLLGDLPAGNPLARNATEIIKAAGRAATLTRQLLAYGRKQFLQPETLDLNRVIASMEGVFQHLMGREVETQIVPAPGLKAMKADAGQIEQVILNMAMNARDAMPNGGKLTLETANVSFDQESVARYPELKPGDYVMLAITDTGTGMTEEVKARIFEPFFTTKGVGQGTGLGLSTCYGIVKQSGGHISVYTELGRGTTFKIYLPQVELPTKIPHQRLDSPDLPRGTETILLAEDDPALREMAATLLKRLGYTVLTAANGVEALSLNNQRDAGPIDLLFTDVVMPHMSGKELSDRFRALYPHTRILFTSAYTESAIVHQGVLDKGEALLQKPFTPSSLARKLREVLDQPCAPKPDSSQKKAAEN